MLLDVLLDWVQKFMLVYSSRSLPEWDQCFPTEANLWGTTVEEQQSYFLEKNTSIVFRKLLGDPPPSPLHHGKPGDLAVKYSSMLFYSIILISTYDLVSLLQIADISSNFIYLQKCIFSWNIFSFMYNSYIIHSAFLILQTLFQQKVSP